MSDKKKEKKEKEKEKKHVRRSSSSSDIEASDSSDNEKLQKKFKLDPSDHALVTMKCHYKSGHGKLRLTVEHLCFTPSGLSLGVTKKLIALKDVLDIELDDEKGVKLTLRDGKSPTFLFKDNREAFGHIEGQWTNTGNRRGASSTLGNSIEHAVVVSSSTTVASGQRSRSGSISSDNGNGANHRYSGNFGHQLNQSLTLEDKISDSYGNDIEKANASMRKHFDVPHSESLVREYQCSHKGSLMQHHGKLYITQRFMYFYSGLASRHQKFTIKLLDVVDICIPEKSKKSILISTKEEAYLFTSFKYQRSVVFKQLNDFLFDSKGYGEVPKLKAETGGFTSTPIQMLIGETDAAMSNQSPKSRLRSGSISDRLEKIEGLSTPVVLPENEEDKENKPEDAAAESTTEITTSTNSTTTDKPSKESQLDKSESDTSKSTKSSGVWKSSKNRIQMKLTRDKAAEKTESSAKGKPLSSSTDTTSTNKNTTSSTLSSSTNKTTSGATTTSYNGTSLTSSLPKSNTISSYSSVSSVLANKPNTQSDAPAPTASTPLFNHDPRLSTKVKKRCCCF